MADEPFPLLDLPILVVVKILRKTRFIDLYILSQISPLMKRVIKNEVKKRNYKIGIAIRKDGDFDFNFLLNGSPVETIRSRQKVYSLFALACRAPELERLYHLLTDTIPTFRVDWDDTFHGAKVMHKEIEEVFSLSVVHIKIQLPCYRGDYKAITRWLKRIGPNSSKVEITGSNVDFLAYTWTMEQFKPSKELEIIAEPRKYHIKGTLKVNAEKVFIHYGEWVSVDNLVAINSSDITIIRSILSTQSVISFLRRLRRGSMGNLKNLRVEFEQGRLPDCEAVFESLGLVLIEEEEPEGEFQLENGDRCVIKCIVIHEIEMEGEEEVEVIQYTGLELKIQRSEEEELTL
ncbi:unnamed protein product [Caenorhabditis brenneri]